MERGLEHGSNLKTISMLTPLYVWLFENNSKTKTQGWTKIRTQTDGHKHGHKRMDTNGHKLTQKEWMQVDTIKHNGHNQTQTDSNR